MPVKYAGRRADVYVLNFSLPRAAGAILDKYAPPRLRTRGQFIARLLFEHEARREERAQLLHGCATRHGGQLEECPCLLQHLREEELAQRQEEKQRLRELLQDDDGPAT